jgi:hypothetical protein
VLVEALRMPEHQLAHKDRITIGSILQQLGWEKRRQRLGGGTRWVYERPTT